MTSHLDLEIKKPLKPGSPPSSAVYLIMLVFSLNGKCSAGRQLDCPHQATLEICWCKMAANWEHGTITALWGFLDRNDNHSQGRKKPNDFLLYNEYTFYCYIYGKCVSFYQDKKKTYIRTDFTH